MQPRHDGDLTDEPMPSRINPLATNSIGRQGQPRGPKVSHHDGQPDPMRTSVDLMANQGRRHGNKGSSGNKRGGRGYGR